MYVQSVVTQNGFNDWLLLFLQGEEGMKNCCSLEFIHGVFLTKKEAIYKIAIKPCVRNLIQGFSLEKHKA